MASDSWSNRSRRSSSASRSAVVTRSWIWATCCRLPAKNWSRASLSRCTTLRTCSICWWDASSARCCSRLPIQPKTLRITRSPFLLPATSALLQDLSQQQIQHRADDAGGDGRGCPGQDDVPRGAGIDGGAAKHEADAKDRADDGVGGGHRQAQQRV